MLLDLIKTPARTLLSTSIAATSLHAPAKITRVILPILACVTRQISRERATRPYNLKWLESKFNGVIILVARRVVLIVAVLVTLAAV